MPLAVQVLRVALLCSLVPLLSGTVSSWRRHPDAAHRDLAVSISLLATTAVLQRVNHFVFDGAELLMDLSIVALLGSGYAMLSFRRRFVPMRLGMYRAIGWVTAAVGAVALSVDLPRANQARLDAAQFAIVFGALLVWMVSVSEPAVRLWLASRRLPAVQRARLRALAGGIAGLVMIVLVAILAARTEYHPGIELARSAFALACVPFLYAGMVAPRWARRRWRRAEERTLRKATEDLLLSSEGPDALADRVLARAIALVGADSGAITGPPGWPLVTEGASGDEAARVARAAGGRDAHLQVLDPATGRAAIVVPVHRAAGTGTLALLSGPYTPFFGTDEVDRMAEYAVSVSAALERASLVDELARLTARHDKILAAASDLGQACLILEGRRIRYANEAACRLTGYRIEELLGLESAMDLLDPSEHPVMGDRLDMRVSGEELVESYNALAVRADGSRYRVELAAKFVPGASTTEVVVVARDVSERTRNLERERRRAAQLDGLASLGQSLAGVVDTERLLPGLATGAREVLGCASARVVLVGAGGAIDRVVASDADPQRAGAAALAARDAAAAWAATRSGTVTVRHGGPGGAGTAVLTVPLFRAGSAVGAVCVAGKLDGTPFDDLDEAVAASVAAIASELLTTAAAFGRERALVSKLREADAMKDILLRAVRHDIGGPLGTVMGWAGMLSSRDATLSGDERREYLGYLVSSATKIRRVLDDLLDVEQITRGLVLEPRREPVDVAALAHDLVAGLDVADHRTVDVDAGIPLVADVDGGKVARIVENLVVNACRHTPLGTRIWVRVRPAPEGVLVVVEDDGPGVPEDHRQSIFEPFRRGPATGEFNPGWGIGLSLVSRFAEMHGGRAWADERPGGGARFSVVLPAATGVAAAGGVRAGASAN